jgi:cellobiose phosphorylase
MGSAKADQEEHAQPTFTGGRNRSFAMSRKSELLKFSRLRAYFRRRATLGRRLGDEPALRAELFSADQMERHGQALAAAHRISTHRYPDMLLARLADNETVLIDACQLLTAATGQNRRISPAAEWLLDNFYLIEEQIRTAQRHLPKDYSRELPRLARGPSATMPRVYDIALEAIAHGDGRVDAESLRRFVSSYQSVAPLKLGELWAIPIMLRLALIENLRRVGARVIAEKVDRNLAESWADQLMDVAERDPKNVVLTVADMARSDPPMTSAFVAEFTRRLLGQSSALALPLTWIEHWLSDAGHTIEYLVQLEAQQQAADQVSIGNSIGSLRALSAIDWREFVETMSLVENTLRLDPAGVYHGMDFATRDQYRHVVEDLAKRSEASEPEVARAAVELARTSQQTHEDLRTDHVGFYLLDKGFAQLEARIGARAGPMESLRRLGRRAPLSIYLGCVLVLTLAPTLVLLGIARAQGFHGWLLLPIALMLVLSMSQLAVSLVNWLATMLVKPRGLPRMDFSKGIPVDARTLVVVPTMLSSLDGAVDLVEALEVRYLANREQHLYFGLLTDFTDAPHEGMEQDELLLQRAGQLIEDLNRKYAEDEDRFFLFHRPRHWNPKENSWMGFERKRGKLADLNALLRGSGWERFSRVVGDIGVLAGVRYVITLDTDTQLPRETAAQFIGAMEHPLNRPRRDPANKLVTEGYGILQPRIGISLSSTARSPYARLFGSDAGIDPYTRAVSDVYQDVFGEGSFIGKGIYDVDAFEYALGGRFPDNAILSHDLIEGCHARSGLLSDVQLYEEHPTTYLSDVSRRERWIRGDWQLLPWLLPRTRLQSGARQRNPLSALSRWKIFDNMRRSLVPAALLASLLFGWASLSPSGEWTLAILAVVLLPPLLVSLQELLYKSRDVQLRQHFVLGLQSTGRHFLRALLTLAWLPHEAFYSLDAIVRTLWRMVVSRRNLLRWNPFSENANKADIALPALIRTLWIGPVLGWAAALTLGLHRPAALLAATPVLLLWFVSPVISWWVSRTRAAAEVQLAAGQDRYLRQLARKTWAFFETYVGPDDNWLPPDNMQEQPSEVVAHRTSPTNIGLALLANLAAHDFGYLSIGRLLDRTASTLGSMVALERHRGHFYNWYDTQTLLPLSPRYVSSVDSGNLAGHLLVLRPGLLALADERLLSERFLHGLVDTLELVESALGKDAPPPVIEEFRTALDDTGYSLPESMGGAGRCLFKLSALAQALFSNPKVDQSAEASFWAQALVWQVQDAADDLIHHTPWLSTPETSNFTDREIALPHPDAHAAAIPTLRELSKLEPTDWPTEMQAAVALGRDRAIQRIGEMDRLAQQASDFAQMQYDFLYDATRHLLSIGYNVQDRRLDASYYDLLASESRLASFVGIAQGKLPQEGWFTLGRLLTTTGGVPVLLSWSGSMFEYLMPLLVMPSFEGTLLDHTGKAAVARQIEYGSQRGVPWGVSESGYNTVDVHLTYQYRAFGVPGLGLKRGLSEDLVIAPYASALALMVAPRAACENLQRLSAEGVEGRYGMYEAIDYTPARLPRGQSSAIIRSFMAHHQGMSLLSMAYVLLDRPMQKRFEFDPQFQATVLLLQERVPKTAAQFLHAAELPASSSASRVAETKLRILTDPDSSRPAVQLLSNGRYHVMVSNAGSGYSRCKDLAVTRWREDVTADNWGTFCYLRDVATGEFWSTSFQPSLKKPAGYEAIFSDARVEFRSREKDFDIHAEIVVSPEDDIELRRTTILNRSRTRRTIEITSYAEVVLAPAISDSLHPAFSKLFVQTELIKPLQAIVCTRRPRAVDEHVPWMCHLMAVHDADVDMVSYETDRSRFIGRGNTVARPAAMSRASLSDSEGSVLDPVVAIRCRITLEPEQSTTIDVVTGIADTREACMGLIEKYRDRRLADRVFDLAWTHSQVLLRQLNASQGDAQLYERLAGSILFATPALRADPGVLIKNRRGQSGLWGQSVSGDLPIVLLQIADAANIDLVRQMVQAHAYWRLKGLSVDLVIWNEDLAGYRQHLQDLIMGLIAAGLEASLIDKPGGIFVRPAHQISSEDRILMQSVARVIISDDKGSLVDQIGRRPIETPLPRLLESQPRRHEVAVTEETPQQMALREGMILRNDFGGFSADGSEYVIRLSPGQMTPAPWVNVLANPHFGTVVSESGGAYTWGENAHEFRLTPWHNDPVSDGSGEAFYLRDEESGQFWSPSPLPSRGLGRYTTRHGFGYSVFEHSEDGISSELWVYVALDASVKFSLLKIRNSSGRTRRLSATGYCEWLLGDLRSKNAMHVVTETDGNTGALFARNAYNMEFPERVAFFDGEGGARTATCDRGEFLGRNRTLRSPAAMLRTRLSGRLGASMDPCAAIQLSFDLEDGEAHEVVFRLGMGRNQADARALVQRYRIAGAAAAALQKVREHWRLTLSAVQVQTPDPALNALANGWLMYQTIACRFWGRSGFYQSGGAFGFRDQLQDSMAMLHAAPQNVREHLLLCAKHQFVEGDVQHWWHPPLDRGVRTRCSDDFLWLPLATSRYVTTTGDTGVLDELVNFVEGRPVSVEEESYYDLPVHSEHRESLYQHCVRAIGNAVARGVHGLPLIGCGDWNDGMNLVGEHGRGESVWLGFFLYDVLTRFAVIARRRQDDVFADRCLADAETLRKNIEDKAWDGAWYRRAYFDDGTPLGSAENDECQIDSIAQSWSVLSGAGDPARTRQAMQSLDQRLVRRDAKIVQLLDPPFDKSALNPGYIKGYVPGVRENGGQYTHAAIWAAMAFAEMGDGARAWEVFDLINPVNHASGPDSADVYKVEPYVVAADVYAVEPHSGRGGWTWYTGSAGWMYRLLVESLLGLRVENDRLRIMPTLRADWPSYKLSYRFRNSVYRITVSQSLEPGEAARVELDGAEHEGEIVLVDDRSEHEVLILLPTSASTAVRNVSARVDD